MLDFKGQVAIVTGGGRGIGRAHSLCLASRGCKVVVADAGLSVNGYGVEDDVAAAVAAEINARGQEAVACRKNVLADASAIVNTAVDEFGRLDILINNAGPVGAGLSLAESPPDEWRAVVDAHYRGAVEMCRAAWTQLALSGSGRILNTSSSAMLGSVGSTDYGSAKAAIFGLTRALALEGAPLGIKVNSLMPSAFTRMLASIAEPTLRETIAQTMAPEHIAAFAAWLVHRDTDITGEAFNVSGGRARRIVMAAAPVVAIDDCSPESWRNKMDALMADGRLTRLTTMIECFAAELAQCVTSADDAESTTERFAQNLSASNP